MRTVNDYRKHFRALVEGQLPKDSRIFIPRASGTLTIFATWRLPASASTTAGRSRIIRIAITEDALADYAKGDPSLRRASDARFATWLRLQIASFDPHPYSPLKIEPLPVTWPLGTSELNGRPQGRLPEGVKGSRVKTLPQPGHRTSSHQRSKRLADSTLPVPR